MTDTQTRMDALLAENARLKEGLVDWQADFKGLLSLTQWTCNALADAYELIMHQAGRNTEGGRPVGKHRLNRILLGNETNAGLLREMVEYAFAHPQKGSVLKVKGE